MSLCIKVCFSLSTILGVAMVVLGAVLYAQVFPKIIVQKVDENLVLRNKSEALDRFENPGVPSYMKFYFFNVTNKDEVNNNGMKPVLKEMGPYVYRKENKRVITAWNGTLGTVTYKENTTYYFEPEMSKGTLQDVINHVNVVSVSMIISKKLGLLASITGTNITEMIQNAPGSLVESHTVDELLFRGFNISGYFPPFNTTYLKLSDACSFVDNCAFAFFLKKNESYSKSFEVKTGMPPVNTSEKTDEAMKHYREIVGYDNKRALDCWLGPSCNALNGTDGTQFPPMVDRHERLYIFTTEVCRSLYLEYEKNQATSGIDGLRFVIPPKGFQAPIKNPDNWCFVTNDTSKDDRNKDGAIMVSACYDDHPVVASAPHFYMGDKQYVEDFVGLSPKKELHESFINVEPMTGVTISAAKRLQINIKVTPDARPKFLKLINKTLVFPVFWASEEGKIDEKSAKMLNDQLMTPYKAGKWSLVAVMALGSLILVIVLIAFVKMVTTDKYMSHNLGKDIVRVGEKNYSATLDNSFHRMNGQTDPAAEKQ